MAQVFGEGANFVPGLVSRSLGSRRSCHENGPTLGMSTWRLPTRAVHRFALLAAELEAMLAD